MDTNTYAWIASRNKILKKIWKKFITKHIMSLEWNIFQKFPLLNCYTQGNVWVRQSSWNRWWVVWKKVSWSRYSNSNLESLRLVDKRKRCVRVISNTLISSRKCGSRNGTAMSKPVKGRKNPLQNKKTTSLPHKILSSFWIKTSSFSR